MALQFALVAMGAALRAVGNFKPGMIVSTATVIINMILAPFLIFGWGTGHPFGVAGAAMSSLIAIVVGIVWLTTYFLPKDSYLQFVVADWRPRFDALAEDAGDRPARRIRVRDDGGVPGRRVLDHAAVRRGGAGGIRHRTCA